MNFFTYIKNKKKVFAPLVLILASVFGMTATAQAQDVDWLVNIDNFGPDPVPAGADIDYTISVTNNGFDAAPATTVSVDIPVNAQYISATGAITGCVSVPASGVGPATVTCNVPGLAGLGVESMVMTVRSSVEGTITTTASVPNASGGVNDINTANNIEPITSTINKGSELGVVLTAPATAAAGSTVPLVFEVTNNGPNINNSFDLEFPIPTGITNVTPPAGCVLTGATYTCTIAGPLAVGASVTRTFTGQISAAATSTVTPTGSIANSDPGDPVSDNNTDLANITITSGSDVSISKTRSPSGALLVGDAVTFTLGAQSTGDNPTGLEILDTLPANYQINSVTAPGWACSVAGQNVACNRATGAGAGADVSLGSVVVETTIVSAGNPVNTATISSAGPVDSDLSNNSASDGGATIAEPVVDLSAVKTGPNPALAVTGQPYTFNIATSNLGNTPFFGTLDMTDHVPAGMTITAAALNGWTCDALPVTGPTNLNCTRTYTSGAPLGVNATTPNVVLTAEFTGTGTISNGLTIGSPDSNVADLNPANDTITYDVDVVTAANSANVGAVKSAAVDPLISGEIQTYTLEITNTGPDPSLDIEVSDTLTGLINNSVGSGYISHAISSGVATGLTCTTAAAGATARQLDCNIDTLPVCTAGADCPVITVQVRPGGNADVARSNTFSAISQTTPDPDLTNNDATATFVVTPITDVTVSKTATPDPVAVGQNITYVVTATNVANGLSDADAVTITDTLPDDLTFISATPSAGSCATAPAAGSVTSAVNNQVVCDLGTIANGGQQTVTIVARPNFVWQGNGPIVNNVAVVTTTPETDATNNTASVSIAVADPVVDILIDKSDSIDPLPIGDNTVYTVVVTNAGPSASENVVMTDSMPPNRIGFQSYVASGGATCSTVPAVPVPGSFGVQLTCSWPYMEAGTSETIQITASGEAKGSTTNTAVVSSTEILGGFDLNAGNNSTTETTTIRTKTDIEVTSKVATPATVNLNENFTFLAMVHVNTGPGLAEADDVVFSDTLPAGMQLTGSPVAVVTAGTASSTICTGAAGGTSFTCDLGTVSSNGTVEITIPVEVVAVDSLPDTLTNTASVSTSSYEAPGDLPNNTNSGNVNVGSSSISGAVFRDFADDSGITAGDTFVAGVPVTLTGTSFDGQPINITVNTNAAGFYEFPFLPEGTYQISRGAVAEPYLTNGTNTAGSEGGTVSSPTLITAIALPAVTAGTDYLFPLIPQARVGIAKQVSGATSTNPDGSFNTTFDLVVENFSLEALDNMVVTDPLAGAAPLFGTYQALGAPATDPMAAGSYTMLAAPSGSCGGTVAGYDGAGTQTVATGFSLASGATCTLSISVRVQPTVPLPPVLASGGRYENQATVTGEGSISGQTSATNPELTDTSDDGANPDPSGNGVASDAGEGDPTPVTPNIDPAIAIVKTADVSALSSPPVVGDIVTYTFAVTNTGNVNLTGVSVTDPMPDLTITGSPIAALAVGATDSSITATYALKLADIDAGQVQNTATAEGTDPYNTVVTDDSGTSTTNDTPTVVNLTQGPAIALIKTADTAALQSPPQAGDIITYNFRVENTGNVTLTNVTITDPLLGGTVPGGPIASMNPGDVDTLTFSADYTLTLADMAAGEVQNTATTTGTPPTGPAVSDDSGTDNTNDVPLVTPLAQAPSILLEKFVDAAPHLAGSVVGDLVEYTFTVTNTGNIPLNNVTVTDALAGVTVNGGPIPVLNPGVADSTTFTATYNLTAGDITAGEVINDATVTGDYGPNNGLQVSDDDTVTLQVGLIEAIPEVFPAFTTDGGTTTSMLASDLLNNAQATLANVNITVITTDPALTLDPATGLITLAPGNPAGTYDVTYEICSVDVPTLCDTTTETVTQGALPGIETVKTQVFTDNGDGRDDVGDIVTYTITVTNTGNTPLSGVALVDTLTDSGGAPLALTTGPTFVSATAGSPEGTLEIGEVATYTATFVLDLQAVNAGGVSNTVTATGMPVYGPGVPGTPTQVSDISDDGIDTDGNTVDDPTVLVLAASPITSGLTMTKTTPQEIVQRGGVVPYTIIIDNTATHVAGPYNIVDTLPPGFIYVPNTATLDGIAAVVTVDGAIITWPNITVPAAGQVVVTLDARILTGANPGAHVNRVSLQDPATGAAVLADATALVRIMPEAVFDCADVIGKVFDDVNGNGYQDAPDAAPQSAAITDQNYYGGKGGKLVEIPPQSENGIPGVRLVTVDGLVITTDEFGRYSVPCAALPADGGDNFIIKLDPRSLPTGYSMTTENPRVARVTPGMMSEVNFGATLGHLARVDVNNAGFTVTGAPVAALSAGMATLATSLVDNPATVVIAYHISADAGVAQVALARERMETLKDQLRQEWRRVGQGPLTIQTLVMREGA